MPTTIIVAHFHHSREVETVTCGSPGEAKRVIEEGNAVAAREWRWGLSATNFFNDDGSGMTIEEANEIRRACGCGEY